MSQLHPTSPPAFRPLKIWLAALLFFSLIMLIVGLLIYRAEWRKAELLTTELSLSYSMISEQVLDDYKRLIERAALERLTQRESRIVRDQVEIVLRHRLETSPNIMDLLILAEDGRIISWTGDGVPPDVRDRSYYRYHFERGPGKTFVSPPELSRVHAGRWFFSLSYGVAAADGSLGGVGVAIIDVEAMQQGIGRLLPDIGTSAALLHENGQFIFRTPPGERQWVGTSATALIAAGWEGGGRSGRQLFELTEADDARWRLVSLQPLHGYNLIASGTVDLDQLLSGWRLYIYLSTGLWLLLLVGGFLVARRFEESMRSQLESRKLYLNTMERLEKISENLPGMIYQCLMTADGRTSFPYVSKAVRRIYGLLPEEIRESDAAVYSRIFPDDVEMVRETVSRSAHDLTIWNSEYRVLHPDGKLVWVEGHATPQRLKNGDTLWHGYIVEITARKELESELNELNESLAGRVNSELELRLRSESHYEAIFEHSPEGVLVIDHGSRFLKANQAAAAMLGYTSETITGKTLSEISPVNQIGRDYDSIEESRRLLQQVADSGAKGPLEWQVLTRSGELRTLEMLIAPFGKRSDEFLLLWRNVTELRELQKQKQLQQAVLIQQTKMAELGGMIGAIAHQWKQPLNSVALIVQNLVDAHEFHELTGELLESESGRILDQVRFMSQTIEDFRNFYRPDREKVEFHLQNEVSQVVDLLRPQTRKDQIEIVFQCGEPILIHGLPGEFKQVVFNIVSNCRDALRELPEGRPREIKIGCRWRDEWHSWAVIEIVDSGNGIDPELLPDRLFELFCSTKSTGTGIGLSLARTIIEDKMQGRIVARNSEKIGAIFEIEIPLRPES